MSDSGPSPELKPATPTEGWMRRTLRMIPELKWALGVAFLAAVFALARSYAGASPYKIAAACLLILGLSVVLVLFATFVSNRKSRGVKVDLHIVILLWLITVLVVFSGTFATTSFWFGWPISSFNPKEVDSRTHAHITCVGHSDASVFIDGKYHGNTDSTFAVPSGFHMFECRPSTSPPFREGYDVPERAHIRIVVRPEPPLPPPPPVVRSRVSVTCLNQENARIKIDDKFAGKGSAEREVSPGHHTAECEVNKKSLLMHFEIQPGEVRQLVIAVLGNDPVPQPPPPRPRPRTECTVPLTEFSEPRPAGYREPVACTGFKKGQKLRVTVSGTVVAAGMDPNADTWICPNNGTGRQCNEFGHGCTSGCSGQEGPRLLQHMALAQTITADDEGVGRTEFFFDRCTTQTAANASCRIENGTVTMTVQP